MVNLQIRILRKSALIPINELVKKLQAEILL